MFNRLESSVKIRMEQKEEKKTNREGEKKERPRTFTVKMTAIERAAQAIYEAKAKKGKKGKKGKGKKKKK